MSISDRVEAFIERELKKVVGMRCRTLFMGGVIFDKNGPLLIEKASFDWCSGTGNFTDPTYNVYLQGTDTVNNRTFCFTVDIRDLP